jgi:transcriptional regulator with XRE-family HTH domain
MGSLGENIANIRKTHNLTQKEFGEKLNFAARTVSDWERNRNEPKIETIKAISRIFKVSYEELLD